MSAVCQSILRCLPRIVSKGSNWIPASHTALPYNLTAQVRLASASSSSGSSYNSRTPYKEFTPPSPYKPNTLPTRYGYKQKLYEGGPLPRINDKEVKTIPKYNPKNSWTSEKALFGQNDYIDIFGDGTIRPYQMMNGPGWLKGFRGNEYQRTLRRLKFTARRLEAAYPKKYADLHKRLRYLYRDKNMTRKSHTIISKRT